jgi:uncharacterized protein (DUF1778 family)
MLRHFRRRKKKLRAPISAIKIGFTEQEYELIKQAAERQGRSVGAFMTQVVSGWMQRPCVVERVRLVVGDRRERVEP